MGRLLVAAERAIRIEADGVRVYAILDGSPTADAVWDALVRRHWNLILHDREAAPPARAITGGPDGR